MRTHIIVGLVAAAGIAVLSGQAMAADTAQQSNMKSCAASWKTVSAADKKKTKYTDYMGTCMKAPKTAAAPAPAPSMAMTAKPAKAEKAMKMAAPAGGGSAKCKDGKIVTYKDRRGTCSGHKGVATWM
ncbi:MAG TPA: DUF3761 domain-containing protein [Rhizomicrobium sp.]